MKYILALIVFACSFPISASAQQQLYISSANFKSCAAPITSGIDTPGSPVTLTGPIQIYSYGFGGSDTGASTAASATGRPVLQSLTFTKKFDRCSGELATDFLGSTAIPQVTLSAYETAGQSVVLNLTITLSNVVVTKYMLADTNNDTATEQIALAFTKACVTTATDKFCYDVSTNSVTP